MDHRRFGSSSIFLSIVAFVFLVHGCSGTKVPSPGADDGEVELTVLALSAADVATVTVTVTGSGIASPIIVPLAKTGDKWGGTIGGIPAGSNRLFVVSARDTTGLELYHGEAGGITIAPGQTPLVTVNAQQVAPAVPKSNAAPVIDTLVVSSIKVAPGESVTLTVTAHDPNPGDTLTYAWNATSGTLSAPTTALTSWTAPATEGDSQITIDVLDPRSAKATMVVDVSVQAAHGRGKAKVAVGLNTWPVVDDISATPTRIDVGETTNLSLVASDSDGDALSYAWTSDCAGTFSSATAKNPSFTLQVVPASKACTLSVGIIDGKGGSNSAAVTIAAGPPPMVDLPPEIVTTYQSSDFASPGATVTLRVVAVDPNGSALSFVWDAPTVGTLGTPSTVGGTSEVVWTAPSVFASNASIRVTVTDATLRPTEVIFTITLPQWNQLAPSGAVPPARGHGAGAVGYDQANNRLLFFGGEAASGSSLNDTWVLTDADGSTGTPAWIQLATLNTPAPHKLHAGAYDPINNRLIIYGGCLGQCTPIDNNVYVLSNANGLGGTPEWQQLSPTGTAPTARDEHSAVYDSASNRLIVFGGDNCCGGRFADTWVLSNANGLGGTPAWIPMTPAGSSPAGRAGHKAAYDLTNNRMMVFGGYASGGTILNDTWVLTNANGLGGTAAWSQLAASGTLPAGRSEPALAYDSAANRLLIFGGSASGFFGDLWSLSQANGLGGVPASAQILTSLDGSPATGPAARSAALTGYNSTSRRLVIFGGDTAAGKQNDVWMLQL